MMLEKGSTVSFRIPKNTDDKLLTYINILKQVQGMGLMIAPLHQLAIV